MTHSHHRVKRVTLNRQRRVNAERRRAARTEHPPARSLDTLTVLQVVVALFWRLRPTLQIGRVRATATGRNLRHRQHENRRCERA
jgi:hypothetical protein